MDVDQENSGEQEKGLYLLHHLEHPTMVAIAEFIKNKTGKVPGVIDRENPGAYIWFPSKEDNEMAQSKLGGADCVWVQNKSRIPARLCWNTSEYIHMTGMNATTTRQQIADFIKQKGGITINNNEICITHSPGNGKKTSAMIDCGSNKNAQQLVKKLNLKEMDGNKVWIEIAVDLKGKTKALIITNVEEGTTTQDVANLLQQSKKIENPPKKIALYKCGSGSHCRINFETEEEAERAYDVLKSSKLKGREIFVLRSVERRPSDKKRKMKQRKVMKRLSKNATRAKAKGKKIDLGEVLATIMTVPVSGKALKKIKKTKDVKMKKKSSKNKGKQKLNGKKKKTKGATNAKAAKGKKAKGKKETGKKAKGKKTKGKSVKV